MSAISCIRFDFNKDVSVEDQDSFLSHVNTKWDAIREAGRLKGGAGGTDFGRYCYMKLKSEQGGLEMTARNIAAALRATPIIETAFLVDNGWPISD